MASRLGVDFDVTAVTGLADKLARVSGQELVETATATVNQVTERAYDLTRKRINAGLSLSDKYVESRFEIRRAKPSANPSATIVARSALTTLGHYAQQQSVQPVKRPTQAKGDPARGIAKGQKPAGVTVAVRRGDRKLVQGGAAFTIPKFKDSEGNALIFERVPGKTASGKPKVRALYGPSVYQLFRLQARLSAEEIGNDLAETFTTQANALIDKALK